MKWTNHVSFSSSRNFDLDVTSLITISAICQANSSFDFSTSALLIILRTARDIFEPIGWFDDRDEMSGGASK
jgi:hypothetical protein